MSFELMRDRPVQKTHGLRSDWSMEENRFKAGVQDFLKSIEIGNPVLDDPPYVFDPEKKCDIEVVADKEVPEKTNKKDKKVQDEANHSVELATVQGANVASPALQPARPLHQEYILSKPDSDPFDSIIESNKSSNYSKPSDDFFDVLEQPKQPVAPPAPAEVKKIAATNIAAAVEKAPDAAKPKSSTHGESKASQEAMEGFDVDRFEHVMGTVNRMLAGLPNVDLDKLLNSLGEYSVCLDLDHMREQPNILTDKLLEIQAKRDSLHSRTMQLTPLFHSMKHAADYFESVGINCSVASSKEKRLAQIKFHEPDFWVRLSNVNRTKASVEQTFQHLEGQYECISRLITGAQLKAKIGEISRGEMPFDPPYKVVQPQAQPVQPPMPTGIMATGTAPKKDIDDDFVNRQFSQPATGQSKFENLETFKPKVDKKTTSQNFVSGEAEW